MVLHLMKLRNDLLSGFRLRVDLMELDANSQFSRLAKSEMCNCEDRSMCVCNVVWVRCTNPGWPLRIETDFGRLVNKNSHESSHLKNVTKSQEIHKKIVSQLSNPWNLCT